MNARVLIAPLVAAAALVAAACERPPASSAAPVPITLTTAQFQQLRWLDGNYRGSGGGYDGFYERYRWTDDSTIRMYNYADSTFARATDSSAITLRGGTLRSGSSQSSYVAVSLDSVSATFAPERGASNGFEWRYAGPGAWTARITWDSAGVPRERVYEMRAVTPPR